MESQTHYWSAIGQALSDNKALGFSLHLSVFPIQLAKSALILLSFLYDRVVQSKQWVFLNICSLTIFVGTNVAQHFP